MCVKTRERERERVGKRGRDKNKLFEGTYEWKVGRKNRDMEF
jgi:hypothetical protein